MENSKITVKSVNIVVEGVIKAKASEVFPLACPIMEYKWISGWKCELINCPNGHVEKDCVFTEIMSAPFLLGSYYGKTTWTAVLHDPDNYRIHYKLDNSISSSLYKIEMNCEDNERTRCRLDFTYNPLNAKGDEIIKNRGREKIHFMLSCIMEMLKYYSEQGEIFKFSKIIKLLLQFESFSFIDKIRLFLNKIAMILMTDKDRNKFFAGLPISKNSVSK